MRLNKTRVSKIEQLAFLAQTEEEKNIVIEASKQICDAENDEVVCNIADNYFKKLCVPKLTNIVDVIVLLLKGGHIIQFTPDPSKTKEIFYLVFLPIPDPPKNKTFVGHITNKQFNELCVKGITSERKHLCSTDSYGRSYLFYQLAEDIILRFRGEV